MNHIHRHNLSLLSLEQCNGVISFHLNNGVIEIVDNWRYLGFSLSNAGYKLVFDLREERKSFFRSSNCIINSLYKPSEEVLMKLYFTNCVSVFIYGIEVKEYLARNLNSVNVAMNDGNMW